MMKSKKNRKNIDTLPFFPYIVEISLYMESCKRKRNERTISSKRLYTYNVNLIYYAHYVRFVHTHKHIHVSMCLGAEVASSAYHII